MNPSNAPVVLITGAARRIGACLSRHLHHAGYRVLIHYHRSSQAATQLASDLNRVRPDSARTLCADLCDSQQRDQLAVQAVKAWARLDALINNASTFYPTPLAQLDEQVWDDLISTNLKAPLFLSARLAPALAATRGCIINLVDIHAQRALAGYPVYSAAKAGLAGLTHALAKDLAPEVRVNGIAPGPILWPEGAAGQTTTQQQQVLDKTLLGRSGTPQDIADTALFLLKQRYITGQIIAVDGGKSLYS